MNNHKINQVNGNSNNMIKTVIRMTMLVIIVQMIVTVQVNQKVEVMKLINNIMTRKGNNSKRKTIIIRTTIGKINRKRIKTNKIKIWIKEVIISNITSTRNTTSQRTTSQRTKETTRKNKIKIITKINSQTINNNLNINRRDSLNNRINRTSKLMKAARIIIIKGNNITINKEINSSNSTKPKDNRILKSTSRRSSMCHSRKCSISLRQPTP